MSGLIWSIRRELWENRSIYLAPLATAAIFLSGYAVSLVGLPGRMRDALALGPVEQRSVIEQPFVIAAIVLMAVALIVAAVYCLDAFYGERRDRSILFWKSLPVSDLTTVLSKAIVPILVIPFLTFALTVVTQLIMLIAGSAVLAASGVSSAEMWAHVPFLRTSWAHFGHMVVYHGLWYAPFYGWLLIVSAWAPRAPFLWATLPPIAIGMVERVAFRSSHFAELVRYRFSGDPSAEPISAMTFDMFGRHGMTEYLISPGLWLGLAVTAGFLFAAVYMRRQRGPI